MAYVDGLSETEEVATPPGSPGAQAPAAAKTPSFTDWLGSPEAMAYASAMLKASGPSRVPISFGQAMGMGGEAMLNAKLSFGNQQLDKDKFAYSKFNDQREYDLKKEDHDITRQLHQADLSNKKQLNDLFFGDDKKPRAPFLAPQTNQGSFQDNISSTNQTNPNQINNLDEQQADKDIADMLAPYRSPPVPSTPSTPSMPQQPGILNDPSVSQQQQATASNSGGLLNNLPPEKKQLAGLMILSGHADKIPEFLLGKPEEPYSLGEGQVRYDKQNRPVAYGIPKDTSTQIEKQIKAEGLTPGTPAYQARMIELNNAKDVYTPMIKQTLAEGLTPGTPEFQNRVKQLQDAQHIVHNISIPSGYIPLDDKNPGAGLKAIPGGPAEGEKNAIQAGKTALLKTAKELLPRYEQLLFNKNPDGSVNYSSPNRLNVFNGSTSIPFYEKSIPWTEGREMKDILSQMVEAVGRASQMKMSTQDMEKRVNDFLPEKGDNLQTIIQKHKVLKDFIGNALNIIDPSGARGINNNPQNPSLVPNMTEQQANINKANSNVKTMSDADLKNLLGIG